MVSLKEELTWKEYQEPKDCTINTNTVYPVEIDYYYKFITGLCSDMQELSLQEEDQWMESQLNMPKSLRRIPDTRTLDKNNPCITQASITDVPLADKRRIDIIERTLGHIELKSAEQHEFLAALTTSASNDMFDMERYELLGDSFLKFATSLFLINKFPQWNEGYLTAVKGKIVSNRNLLYCMMETDLVPRIYGTLFRPNADWLPPLVSLPENMLQLLEQHPEILNTVDASVLYNLAMSEEEILTGKCNAETLRKFQNSCKATITNVSCRPEDGINEFVYKQVFYDKTVADMLEAILGVCVKNYGIRHAFRLLGFFGVLPSKPLALETLLDATLSASFLRANLKSSEVDGFLINYQYLENNLGYKFRDRMYLLQALTHPSFPTNRLTGCYQELEFLGDAILDFFISCYIYERYQHLTPGKLTDLRMALVNNITLACVCVRHRFHLFMLAENAKLSEAIKSFADFQETQNHSVTEQVRILMEEPLFEANSDYENSTRFNLSANVDVPKALGDILEAIIAAVFLDSKNLETTWHVIYHMLEKELNQFSHNVPIDAVRALHEHKHAQPKFSDPVVHEDVVMMKCEFRCLDNTVEVNGFGCNKLQAKKSAAKHALKILAKHSA